MPPPPHAPSVRRPNHRHQILDEVVKLRQILRTAGGNGGSSRTAFLGYAETLMSVRCLAMGAFWTFDNLNYLTITETVCARPIRESPIAAVVYGIGFALI